MAKKNIISQADLGISLVPTKLIEKEVDDIAFFNSDIDEFNKQLISAEKLYTEVHNLWDGLTGGDYMPTKSVKDVAELGKTLVSARSLCSDIAHKRHQAKKNISDIVHKKNGTDGGDTAGAAKEIAREMLTAIRQGAISMDQKTPPRLRKAEAEERAVDKQDFEQYVNECIDTGQIQFSTNDKLIGVSDFVKIEYDTAEKGFVAVDGRDGTKIVNFPKTRLPGGHITKQLKDVVYTSNGETYDIRGKAQYGMSAREDDE